MTFDGNRRRIALLGRVGGHTEISFPLKHDIGISAEFVGGRLLYVIFSKHPPGGAQGFGFMSFAKAEPGEPHGHAITRKFGRRGLHIRIDGSGRIAVNNRTVLLSNGSVLLWDTTSRTKPAFVQVDQQFSQETVDAIAQFAAQQPRGEPLDPDAGRGELKELLMKEANRIANTNEHVRAFVNARR